MRAGEIAAVGLAALALCCLATIYPALLASRIAPRRTGSGTSEADGADIRQATRANSAKSRGLRGPWRR